MVPLLFGHIEEVLLPGAGEEEMRTVAHGW
jgi:hypothetical protein